jgi:hypothetical protein
MNQYTADPSNPRGRRTGSLIGSGTHDDHETDCPGDEPSVGCAQEAGVGASELAAFIAATEDARE